MSIATKRAELATVLSTVTDVKGYEFRPTVFKKGDAWPLLSVIEREGSASSATWRIILALGGDERTAMDFADGVLPELVDKVDPVAYVISATPLTLSVEGGEEFAFEIRVISE